MAIAVLTHEAKPTRLLLRMDVHMLRTDVNKLTRFMRRCWLSIGSRPQSSLHMAKKAAPASGAASVVLAWSGLKSSQQTQNQHDHEDRAEQSAGRVTPARAVGPGGQRPNLQQNQNDDQNGRKYCAISSCRGHNGAFSCRRLPCPGPLRGRLEPGFAGARRPAGAGASLRLSINDQCSVFSQVSMSFRTAS